MTTIEDIKSVNAFLSTIELCTVPEDIKPVTFSFSTSKPIIDRDIMSVTLLSPSLPVNPSWTVTEGIKSVTVSCPNCEYLVDKSRKHRAFYHLLLYERIIYSQSMKTSSLLPRIHQGQ
ncbi:hypothetical protein RRG08_025190 [Elysia crispata]|uniref:Uncharacterized protein n=1 Tax=Elysia crispata TaxID=231223 RepID=A0AAE0ZBH7_9GAST|nr:hypothetical protein RRG08_025190 [Elysia crispata]